jgi:hypothetical protein
LIQPSEQQVNEWLKSLVSEYLNTKIDEIIKDFETIGLGFYHPGEPQKTQELMAGANGALDTWYIVKQLLQGDFSYFEGDKDVERSEDYAEDE